MEIDRSGVNEEAAARFGWRSDGFTVTEQRVSDEIQTTTTDQRSMNRRCSEQVLGLPAPEWASFTEVEHRSFDRVQHQRALEMMMDPRCVAAVLWIPSRAFGDPIQTLTAYRHMQRYNVRLFDKDGKEFDVQTHIGQLIGMIQGWQSEAEVIELRKRISDTHGEKARIGRLVSRAPYGVMVVPAVSLPCKGECLDSRTGLFKESDPTKRRCEIRHGERSKKNGTVWIVDEEHRRVLTMLYAWAAEGVGLGEIERRLAERGIVTPVREATRGKNAGTMRGGTPWSKSNIRKLLLSPFYRGEIRWGMTKIVWYGPDVEREQQPADQVIIRTHALGPLVDVRLWDEAGRQIALRHKTRDQHRRYGVKVFDGFVYCGRCGWRMYPRKRAKTLANGETSGLFDYACNGVYNIYSSCTKNHAIPESRLFKGLKDELEGVPTSEREFVFEEAEQETQAAAAAELESIKAELRGIVKEIDRIEDLMIGGDITKAKGRQKKAEAERRRSALVARRRELEARPKRPLQTGRMPDGLRLLGQRLDDDRISVDERRRSLSRLVDRIVVDRPGATRVVVRKVREEAV